MPPAAKLGYIPIDKLVATEGFEPPRTRPLGLSQLRLPFRHVAVVLVEGLEPTLNGV